MFRTESALAEKFSGAFHYGTRSSRLFLPEVGGIQGQADFVDAQIRALPGDISLESLAASLSSPAKAGILAVLRKGAPRTKRYVQKVTGLSDRALESHIRALQRTGIVEIHDNLTISLCCPLPANMIEIAAYEAKLSNWRRALHQALGYRAFSHSVSVVMPAEGSRRARELGDLFRSFGVGLISIEDDGSQRIRIRSRKSKPRSRRLYLTAVGTILNEFIKKRRRLHRRIRPESIQSL